MTTDDLLDLAVRAARQGEAEIVRRVGAVSGIRRKSSLTDLVSDADHASDAAIARLIHAERPDDGILSEEGIDRPSASGFRWVVDGLDGTANFLSGIPHFAVSIACERFIEGTWAATVGVVHDCARGETFTATADTGACLGDALIGVNDPVPLPIAIVATEFSYHASARAAQAETLAGILSEAGDIRTTGSSSLDLCWTAAGRFDAFYESELFRWDWAAGALIVAEAGGRVATLGTGVFAAGPTLFDQMCGVVLGRERPAVEPVRGWRIR